MSIRPLLTGWDSQPQEAVGIDLGNPLTHGLVRLIPAPQLPEVVEGNFATTDTTVNALTSTGRSRSYASGTYAEWAMNRSQITNAVTIFSLLDIVVSGSPNNFLVGDVQAGGLGYNYGLYSNSTFFSFFLKTGGAGTGVNGTSLSNVDRRGVCLAGTYDGADQRIFVNGVQEGSTAKTGNVDAGAFSLVLNRWNGDSAHTGRHYLTGVWNRALSAQELQSLTANPWQLFAPIPIPANTYTPPPAPTGKRYRQIVSGWDSQPQGAVEVDWLNPLSLGLMAYASPFSQGTRMIKAVPLPPTGITKYGLGAESSFGGDLDSRTMSMVMGLSMPADTANYIGAMVQYWTSSSVNFSFGIQFDHPSNQIKLICRRNFSGYTASNVGYTLSVWPYQEHIMVTVDDWTTAKLYKNASATPVGSTAPGGTGYVDSSQKMFTVGGPLLNCAYAFLYNRVLTNAEDKSLRDNPWQLFAPLTTNVPIYTPPAGIPLLSSPTLSSITTTTARPQVSITFP